MTEQTTEQRIQSLFGRSSLRRSAIGLPGGEDVFRRLFADCETVLEIGTYHGCSAAAIAQCAGRVITIDLESGQLERLGQVPQREVLWRELGIENIEFHAVHGDDEKARLIDGLDFDAAFIDGAHDTQSVARDFAMVQRCGFVLFHDYSAAGVRAFLDTLDQIEPVGEDFAVWRAPR